MIDEYYEKMKRVRTLMGNPTTLLPALFERDCRRINEGLNITNNQLVKVFSGDTVDPGDAGKKVYDVSHILLTVALERSLNKNSAELLKLVCMLLSLWNSKVGKSNSMEDVLTATMRLVEAQFTLRELLDIFRVWSPRLKSLTQQPLAFDVAGHYLSQMTKQMEEEDANHV